MAKDKGSRVVIDDASDDIAIRVSGVSKSFRLPHNRQSSIKGSLVNLIGGGDRSYETQEVLKNVSFEIKRGEFFGIVGRNGSGKSTLLKLLGGIYKPSAGQITVNGSLTPFIELGVGFNPELTGRENVYMNGALLGFNAKEVDAMYDDIVSFAELERFMDQKLKNYSSGMQVRLAFSVAIQAQTDILLIDEVLAVGDQSFQEKCFEYFAAIKRSNKTVIFVTHDMSNVERFCDRVFVLDKKKEVNGIYTIPEAVAVYNDLNHEKQPTETNATRKHSRGLYIKDVKICNKHGVVQHKFSVGDELNIDIVLAGNGPKEEPITIGLAFNDKENTNLAGPNSLGHALIAQNHKIRYSIKRLPFNMGEYFVTIALLDGSGTMYKDRLDKSISFFVNTPKTHIGKVVLEDSWEIK